MTDQTQTLLSNAEIDEILQKHELWLVSGRKKGAQADFSNKIIQRYDFSEKQLPNATFYNSRIFQCSFFKADLNDASFIAAEIDRCNFIGALLYNVDFSWGSVKGCTFEGSTHLAIKNFRRANLSNSIFPTDFSFDNVIAYTDVLIKKARNIFGVYLGFSITTLFLLLFGKTSHKDGLINLPLPLISKEVSLSIHEGLILNFIIIMLVGIFYSLSLSSIKKQLDKYPAVFPDGRFAHETVFPWFWVTWDSEIWQNNYKSAPASDKHILWQRLLILTGISNMLFVTIFVILLLAVRQLPYLLTLIDSHQCGTLVFIAILFIATLIVAYKTREKFYFNIAILSALIVWGSVYFFTNLDFALLVSLAMIVTWWCDSLTYSNEPFTMDISAPDSYRNSNSIKEMHRYVKLRFTGMNVALGAFYCLAAALYIFFLRN